MISKTSWIDTCTRHVNKLTYVYIGIAEHNNSCYIGAAIGYRLIVIISPYIVPT